MEVTITSSVGETKTILLPDSPYLSKQQLLKLFPNSDGFLLEKEENGYLSFVRSENGKSYRVEPKKEYITRINPGKVCPMPTSYAEYDIVEGLINLWESFFLSYETKNQRMLKEFQRVRKVVKEARDSDTISKPSESFFDHQIIHTSPQGVPIVEDYCYDKGLCRRTFYHPRKKYLWTCCKSQAKEHPLSHVENESNKKED